MYGWSGGFGAASADQCAAAKAIVAASGGAPNIRMQYGPLGPLPNPEDIAFLSLWAECTGTKSTLPDTPPPPAPTPKTPVVVVNSSGPNATTPGATDPVIPPASGFSLSDIPWWAWIAGAGVGVFAMKGKR